MNVLYHYCSTSAFHAIVESAGIQLSSLSLANDTLEGKIVTAAIERLGSRDKLDESAKGHLSRAMQSIERIVDNLGFCLSEEGDLLSQWRGYAADGTGVAIGFSADYLQWLSETYKPNSESTIPGFALTKVLYDPSEHEKEVEPTYTELKKTIQSGGLQPPSRPALLSPSAEEQKIDAERYNQQLLAFSLRAFALTAKLFRLKSPAFREEREWRLLSPHVRGSEEPRQYRATPDRVIPFRTYELREPKRNPIARLVLGPKHLSPVTVAEGFLTHHGFKNVAVIRSDASYR